MKEHSIKCGRGICEFYCSKSESKCSKYDDRNKCAISNKQRRKSAYKSKKRNEEMNFYYKTGG